MITIKLQFFAVFAVVLFFSLIFILLKKNRIELRYSILWFFSGFVMLLISIFPEILNWFSNLVGINIPANALFAVTIFIILMLMLAFTSVISREKQEIIRLVQEMAILENRIRQLESRKENVVYHYLDNARNKKNS